MVATPLFDLNTLEAKACETLDPAVAFQNVILSIVDGIREVGSDDIRREALCNKLTIHALRLSQAALIGSPLSPMASKAEIAARPVADTQLPSREEGSISPYPQASEAEQWAKEEAMFADNIANSNDEVTRDYWITVRDKMVAKRNFA